MAKFAVKSNWNLVEDLAEYAAADKTYAVCAVEFDEDGTEFDTLIQSGCCMEDLEQDWNNFMKLFREKRICHYQESGRLIWIGFEI